MMVRFSICLVPLLTALSSAVPLVDSIGATAGRSNMGCTRPLPLIKKQNSIAGPVISSNFPDPAVIRVREQYYAFSTNSDGKQVPVASSSGDNKWEVSGMDALPNPGSWATGIDTWAPDVVELVSFQHHACANLANMERTMAHLSCIIVRGRGTTLVLTASEPQLPTR